MGKKKTDVPAIRKRIRKTISKSDAAIKSAMDKIRNKKAKKRRGKK